uniref:Uncharacterized protein n=1 Tax=Romanomermis culicivorax TaxID=13658 RepID=A0A915IQW3_ROMCU
MIDAAAIRKCLKRLRVESKKSDSSFEKFTFFANSTATRRVIFSNSRSLYFLVSILTPALAPPNGTLTAEHLYVMRAARALTSSSQTSIL